MFESYVEPSHGLLANNVDATLASLLYSCTTDAVFSEVHDQWASRERSNQIKSDYLLRRPSSVAQGRKYRPTTTMQIHNYTITINNKS